MKMNRIKYLLLTLLLLFSFTGCSTRMVAVNFENEEYINNLVYGTNALIEIGNGLYYDSNTRIVYWWTGIISGVNEAKDISAYYAPNGLPYRYNPETNTLEQIGETNEQ